MAMPSWIYLDIFYLFTKWDNVFEALMKSLVELVC